MLQRFTKYIGYCIYSFILPVALARKQQQKDIFWSSNQADASCPLVYRTRLRLHTTFFNTDRQAEKLEIPILIIFGLTRSEMKPHFTVSVVNTLLSRRRWG